MAFVVAGGVAEGLHIEVGAVAGRGRRGKGRSPVGV